MVTRVNDRLVLDVNTRHCCHMVVRHHVAMIDALCSLPLCAYHKSLTLPGEV